MSTYPDSLYQLISESYRGAADITRLVELADVELARVEQSPKPSIFIHSALTNVFRSPQSVAKLRKWITIDGYMTEDIADEIDRILLQSLRSPPMTIDELDTLAAGAPHVEDFALIAGRAGLTDSQCNEAYAYPDDARRWRSLVIIAQLHGALKPLLKQIATLDPGNSFVTALLTKIDDRGRQGGESTATEKELRPEVGQQASRTGRERAIPDGENVTRPTRRAPRRSDPRVAVQQSAVEALDRLHKLMDEALERFAREDAHDHPYQIDGLGPAAFLDEAISLRDQIEWLDWEDSTDEELLGLLQQLISTVLAGIDVATAEKEYGIVADLAQKAAYAYDKAAERLTGPTADLLRRVVPYWEMKEAHARHDDKVQRRLARPAARRPRDHYRADDAQTSSTATRNPFQGASQ